MEFGFINLLGGIIVILILIPNIIWAARGGGGGTETAVPKALTVCEQTGRYGCMLLMWLPLFVWEFGFRSFAGFAAYAAGNGALLIAYYVTWFVYAKKRTLYGGMALAVIPAAIFLLSGVLLGHWCLAAFAVLFGVPHGAITYLTHGNMRG